MAKIGFGTDEYYDRLVQLEQEFVGTETEFYNCVQHTRNKAKFKCPKCGGVYETVFSYRIYSGQNCPYCAGKRVLPGYNDLESRFPDIAADWDYSKNTCNPSDILAKSDKIVHWKCINGHEWSTPCSYRTVSGNGCPYCNNNQTSFPEKLILYWFRNNGIEANNREKINGTEFDIVVHSLKLCIEYDGGHWHNINSLNKDKESIASNKGYRFIRIQENDRYKQHMEAYTTYIDDELCTVYTEQLKRKVNRSLILLNTLNEILNIWYGITLNIVDLNINKIISNSSTKLVVDSLVDKYSELMEEWDPDNSINPNTLSKGSDARVKWICKHCGHKWEAYISSRTNLGSGCPECGKKLRALSRRYNIIDSYELTTQEKQRLFKEFLQEKQFDNYIIDLWLSKFKK